MQLTYVDLRKLRPEIVEELAESILQQGLLQPIRLRPRSHNGSGYILIAGQHRLEAVRSIHKRRLGPGNIRAEIIDDIDADSALLAEIDENLIRAELSPAERAMHTDARKTLYEKMHPETKKGGAPGKAGGGKKPKSGKLSSFASNTASKTRKSKKTVEREAKRGKDGKDWLEDIAGTSLDKGDEIDALIKLPPDRRHGLIARAVAGEKVSAKLEAKRVRRAEREQVLAESTAAAAVRLGQEIPASVVVIDWALRFEVWSERGMDRSPENHYPCGSDMAGVSEALAHLDSRLAWDIDRIMSNLPARGVGGGVFVVDHAEAFYRFYSVVHIVEFNCWQSSWIYTREEADLVAEMVALHCKAKLIPEVRI